MQKSNKVEDEYELSTFQQGVLFHILYAPETGVYVEQRTFTLHGRLDAGLFEQAWRTVVARHPMLRSSVQWRDCEKPLQVVHREVQLTLDVLDYSALGVDEQRSRIEAHLNADRRRGFELSTAPLFRLTLVRTGSEEHELVLSFQQLILDEWSVGLAMQEVLFIYRALHHGHLVDLRPALGYRAYVAWQGAQKSAEHAAYWADRLRGFTSPNRLEIGSAPRLDHAGRHHEEPFSHERTECDLTDLLPQLEVFGRSVQLNLETLVQGAWMILVSRHTGDADVVVGSTTTSRPPELAESANIMGPMVTTLPIRATVSKERPVLDWLLELQQRMVEASEHAHCPLVELQRGSEVPRDQALFESTVVFENARLPRVQLDDIQLRLVETSSDGRPHYPMTLVVAPGERLLVRLIHERRRFRSAMAHALLTQLRAVLGSIVRDSEKTIDELDWLGDEERQRLLLTHNDTARAYPSEPNFHRAIEVRAEETPEAVALVFESGHMTYGELNARANQLAQELLSRGADSRTPIAVMMERSPEMVIALLAVIKTGSPYLPVEPGFPELRRTQMLITAGAGLVVTRPELVGRLGDFGARAVCVTRDDSLGAESNVNPSVPVGPDSALYVIFTSGSTGSPKGVVNLHAALCNRLQWMQEQFRLRVGERVLQKTPFTFDVSVWEIFWPLRVGATLVLARPEGHRDPVYLAELIERERISTVHFVPSLLQVFLDVPELGRRSASLTRIVCSGEELPRSLADRCLRALQGSLFNLYGPTEAAIDVSCWECRAEHDETTVPIGRPISNTQLYVLDEKKRPVPVGAKGELHIAGAGLAWGYAGRPDLTAERFSEVDLPGVGRRRVYCTSDLARFREDGAIEYCGRSDHQIKLRGNRIELGEIECVLRSAPGVKDAVVTVQELGPSDRQLVAYVVGVEARATVATRRFLRERLPEYMVPARFVSLAALPVGANGKVARDALPAPSVGRTSAAQGTVAEASDEPSTATEKRLAAIVGRLLATERVGIGDNLRDRGFHSLLATFLLKLLQDELGTTLPMRTLFERPTVRELAEEIDRDRGRAPKIEGERVATSAGTSMPAGA